MLVRWIVAATLLVTLAIVGIFVWAVFRPPPDSAAGAPASAARQFGSGAATRVLRAEVIPRSADTVSVVVSVTDAARQPVTGSLQPTAALTMIDMAMGTLPVPLTPDGPGVWRGEGSLSMAGRWNLRVSFDNERLDVVFDSPSR